ncbi:MAG TPA: SBBP repeat-containing protein, partial [Gemmatimonadales bacterium]|nr:SBBP repeat-containing protein [Gemmatimonadales bacterium]
MHPAKLTVAASYGLCLAFLLTTSIGETKAAEFSWAKQLGGAGTGFVEALRVAVDTNGNVYTVGYFQNTVDFDPGPGVLNLTSGSTDAFISKLDAAGNLVWARQLGGTAGVVAEALALDASNNVYVAGEFQGVADLDPGPGVYSLTSAGAGDIYTLKLNSAGEFSWARQLAGVSFADTRGLAIDGAGGVYTVGSFQGTVDFDPGTGIFNLTATSTDIYISKLNSAGAFVWAEQFAGTSYTSASGAGTDLAGNVYVAGVFQATVDFDPGPAAYTLTSAGSNDGFITKLSSAGAFVWARSLAGALLDSVSIISI